MKKKYFAGAILATVGLSLVIFSRATATVPGTNALISVDGSGNQATGGHTHFSHVSKDGNLVVFQSLATNLVAGDTNAKGDIFLRDLVNGTTTMISKNSSGTIGDNNSFTPRISRNGRYIVFSSQATNLIASDTNSVEDVFLYDRTLSTMELVSQTSSGTLSNNVSSHPTVSDDGRYVTFSSTSTNLVASDTNAKSDIFVKDRSTGNITRINLDSGGTQANDNSTAPNISCEGRFIVFSSSATNLTASDTNGVNDVFLYDAFGSQITNITQSGNGYSDWPVISCDGSTVAFTSTATNLVASDTNAKQDIFVWTRNSNTYENVHISTSGTQADDNENINWPTISDDGTYVLYSSHATNLVASDTNATPDIFIRNRKTATTERISVTPALANSNGESGSYVSVSGDGEWAVYNSGATNLVGSDTNGKYDIFRSATGIH